MSKSKKVGKKKANSCNQAKRRRLIQANEAILSKLKG
jgi:hypothetical protein